MGKKDKKGKKREADEKDLRGGEDERGDDRRGETAGGDGDAPAGRVWHRRRGERQLDKEMYKREIARLQTELVKLQGWIKDQGLKVLVIFEGRDAAGKGGVIKRITDPLSARICRVAALPAPSDTEKTQWYFQRYVQHLPSGGNLVLFDRSWYNRAGVERVMGYCSQEEYKNFLRDVPIFEQLLINDGIILIKYWFSVSEEEQERRFQARLKNPMKQWKLSPMDIQSRNRWHDYSLAKDEMMAHTDSPHAPWYVVNSDNKKRARLNCIHHLLSLISYDVKEPALTELPPREGMNEDTRVRPPLEKQKFIPDFY